MKFFYLGILVQEIVNISPSTDSAFETVVTLRGGVKIDLKGDWEAHTEQLEQIMKANHKAMMRDWERGV